MALICNGIGIKKPVFNGQAVSKILCNGVVVFQKDGKVMYGYSSGDFTGSGNMIKYSANISVPGVSVTGTLLTPNPKRNYIEVTVNEDISSLTLSFGSGSKSGMADAAGGDRIELYVNGKGTNVWYTYRYNTSIGATALTYLSKTLTNLKAGDVVSLYVRNGPSSNARAAYRFYSPKFVAVK